MLIVDDHDLYRIGLATLLDAEPQIEVAAQGSGGRMGVRLAGELQPDVVLMDLRMPDLDGYEATRAILAERPGARVLALTVAGDDATVERAIRAGACGFLAKETPVEDVVAALHAAARGVAWLGPGAADAVLGRMRGRVTERTAPDATIDPLSDREREVLRLLAEGLENSQIAQALGVAPRTVRNHVSRILEKLGVDNRIQAAVFAVRSGLD